MGAAALDIVRTEALSVRAVRTAYGCWHTLLLDMARARNEFRSLGELAQAEALAKDIEHMTRRAMRHLRRLQIAVNDNGRAT